MIVSREYIPFRKLITCYDKGGVLFVKLCKKSYPVDMRELVFLELSEYALYERQMEWAFREIGALVDGFRELDEKEPYDTGYELKDARKADILCFEGNTMKLMLRTGEDAGNDIVGVVDVEVK